MDSLSTFTATELMEYEEFVALTVLAAGVGLDRKGIKEKVCLSRLMGTSVGEGRKIRPCSLAAADKTHEGPERRVDGES